MLPAPRGRRHDQPRAVPRCPRHGRVRVIATSIVVLTVLTVSVPAATAARPATRYPPSDLATFRKLFERPLRRFGLRVQRAETTSARTYRRDPHGDKLAVYLQPTGSYTADDYLRNAAPTAQVFLPAIFDRWKGLQILDLCQEPLPSIDNRREPASVTQLALTRSAAARIPWSHATLATLLAPGAHRPAPPGLGSHDYGFVVQAALHAIPAYQQAQLTAQTG
jgi:hypothetical protein